MLPKTNLSSDTNFDKITAVIPVREDSSRIPKKVLLPFNNEMNLLEWKISQLMEVLSKNRIVVSTNSPNLISIARNAGVEYHHRSDHLCEGHKASFSEVITGVIKDIPTPHFAWVTVVVPLMKPIDYKRAFECYIKYVMQNNNHDSLFSANILKEYLWDERNPINYQADKNHTISQNLPNIYKVTNALYMRDKASTLRDGYFLGQSPFKYVVDKSAGIDIDEWEDYEFAKRMIPFYESQL